MANYGRDLNIGRPTAKNLAEYTEVQNFDAVLAKLETAIQGISEVAEELKKIKMGTGLTIGVDLDEEAE